MKNGLIGGVIVGVVVIGGIIGLTSCVERIPNGYVGVQYSMSGGVKDEVLNQGFHIVSPTTKVKEFTVANEQLVLSKDDDNSFNVATSDNASIAISFQMSYKFDQASVVDTYKKFRGMDGEDIVNNRIRSVLKSKISEVTSEYSMMDIYSGNRSQINHKIQEHLNKEFEDKYGIEVFEATIVDVHPNEQLQKTIEDRVAALQKKQQAEAEQETAKVEAETALIKAQNDAKIKIAKAEAEAEANKKLSASITDNLIKMKEAEARVKHGWVTINGANTIVTDNK